MSQTEIPPTIPTTIPTAIQTTIRIPAPLRSFTGGRDEVAVQGQTVRDALRALVAEYGGLERHLFGPDGELRDFINVYLGDRNIRALDGLASTTDANAVLSIVPAVAGGLR